jgi:DNA repair protein RadD
MKLRPYQQQAIAAVYEFLRIRDDNPCVVIPTAGGKTPVMAAICKDAVTQWGGRVLILAHVRELIEQMADKLRRTCPEVDIGINSASLKRRDRRQSVIVASIQTVHQQACELDRFDLILIDEAHMIPPDGDGMYQRFLADAKKVNPQVRVIGFTATPFRLKDGPICSPDGILNAICYEVGVKELIRDGFLCPLVTKSGLHKVDTSQLHVRAGEFVAEEVERLMDQDAVVEPACGEIVAYARQRNAVLLFASGIDHGRHIVRILAERHNVECGFVTGDTPVAERDAILSRFRSGQLKFLCNVNVLSTGFDAPHIDCVALMRPTMSAGLFYQMVGRGFRLHENKRDCLVLDYGGNVLRHGPVDELRAKPRGRGGGGGVAPAKECPECQELMAVGYGKCARCGYTFPPPDRQAHEAEASHEPILSGEKTEKTATFKVLDTYYSLHRKANVDGTSPPSLRVDYKVGWHQFRKEWVCFEHQGYPRQRAVAWWNLRSPDRVPDTVEQAIEAIEGGAIAQTLSITTRQKAGDKFETIVGYELGPLPDPLPPDSDYFDNDEVPF